MHFAGHCRGREKKNEEKWSFTFLDCVLADSRSGFLSCDLYILKTSRPRSCYMIDDHGVTQRKVLCIFPGFTLTEIIMATDVCLLVGSLLATLSADKPTGSRID